ncbi:MAG: UvrD-helicase domain-containing protein [Phycisphaerales bacterium]|nr:UvrD-helicase domain-containing protein [Phycisphaerales bacterium]
MNDATPDYLQGLTEPQRSAVLCTEGPLLILAAAGSGKTRVITRRIAHLVANNTPPWSILALTFTNKAAGEMRERVALTIAGPNALDEDAPRDPRLRGLTITTFHSLCARLLRRYAERANLPGLKPDYTIYDSSDQMAAMKRVLKSMNLQASNWPPRSVLSTISTAKNEMMDAKKYEANAFDYYSKQVAKIYLAYEQALRNAGAIDFDDLLLYTARILETNPEIKDELNARWKYLLIDEYQDTNSVQFKIASLLASAPPPLPGMEDEPSQPNICVVGDPDQAIYGWRGADISNILDFEEHYPGAKVIMLGENFRSTEPILNAADTLIKHNTKRKDKPLYTSKPGGDPITVITCNDERHEAELVADWFRELNEKHSIPWKDMAVFYRTNALSRVMEDAMRQSSVPYRIARGTAFFEREEIKNAIAYLRVIANPADTISLLRIINTPTRGIGKTTLDTIQGACARAGITLWEGLNRCAELGLSDRATKSVKKFTDMINDWTGGGTFMGASLSSTLHELVERVIEESTLEAHYTKQAKASGAESDEERLDNLNELITSARDFEREYDPAEDPASFTNAEEAESGNLAEIPPLLALVRAYLESIALIADADAVDNESGAVTLMTLHASKGLEFPAVAMIALEEGTLPHSRANESVAELEEERRLAFVGITRSMKHLQLTTATRRTIRGITERTIKSRFLEEIGSESIIFSDQADDDFGGGGIDSLGEYDDAFSNKSSSSRFRAGSFANFKPDHQAINDAREKRLANVKPRESTPVAKPRPSIIPGGQPSASQSSNNTPYPVGCTVSHPQFGEGVVMKTTPGQNARVIIEFKAVGRKTLVLEYARLKRIR